MLTSNSAPPEPPQDVSAANVAVLTAIATLTEKVSNLEKRLERGNSMWPVVLSGLAVIISLASKVTWQPG